jgi:hypothetical protein
MFSSNLASRLAKVQQDQEVLNLQEIETCETFGLDETFCS